MENNTLILILSAFIGGGGLVALINVLANRNKNKSEVTDINVKTAIELEKMAMVRYTEASEALVVAKRELAQAKDDLIEAKQELVVAKDEYYIYKRHCSVLEDILNKHDIDIPAIQRRKTEKRE